LVRPDACNFDTCADELRFFRREPSPSRFTGIENVHGRYGAGDTREIVSQMPESGVLFGDGIKADYLPFNSGAVTARWV
jgi:hypothetical protein